jgi:hypothetical protein
VSVTGCRALGDAVCDCAGRVPTSATRACAFASGRRVDRGG